jgi:hydrogenase expression/formation protein HypE
VHAILGINTETMDEQVTLNHGSGGKLTHKLITDVFVNRFGTEGPLTDSAIIREKNVILATTIDSYVVDPIFFPGGNIGKLAVCGTVNDLAVSGAVPSFLSAAFIIEEGLPVADLERIVASMAEEAVKAGVRIVAGDTKVVERGKCDKLFITTAGYGFLDRNQEHISTGDKIKEGDRIIINGAVGDHALAVLGARKNFDFKTPVISDCSSLNHLVRRIISGKIKVKFMRDVTRGGLAAVLNELSEMTGRGIEIDEASVPVNEPVRGLCEMLGFDPLYLANEGKMILVVDPGYASKAVELMKQDELGKYSSVIGEITNTKKNIVTLNTPAGGRRIIYMPTGLQLPRIC